MPKISNCLKCLKLRNSVDFIKIETIDALEGFISGLNLNHSPNLEYFKNMERSDAIILGILGNLDHFRHFQL